VSKLTRWKEEKKKECATAGGRKSKDVVRGRERRIEVCEGKGDVHKYINNQNREER